jgi:DNA-binding response OmpR family regulator
MAEKLRQAPKVLVVSNQLTTGPLWVLSLKQQLFVNVVLEPDPANLLHCLVREIPDLVILDVNISNSVLLGMIRDLRRESIIPILLFTSNSSEEFIVQAYQAGVDECILKPVGASLFHAKINVWLRRTGNVASETLDPLRAGNYLLNPAERILVMANGGILHLTNLELRLLYSLMSQPGRTLTSESLIQRVWGSNFEADNTVLKNIIYRLRQKVETNPADPHIIQTVVGVGYRFNA